MTWREHCAPIIAKVLTETKGLPEKEIRKALKEAYSYGERAMHPYRIWCDEIKCQRGLKRRKKVGGGKRSITLPDNPNQTTLF